MKLTKLAAMALFSLSASPSFAESTITIENARIFEATASAMTTGGFMEITNTGTTDDRLLAVEADFPRVEVHTTEMTDGVARMMHVEALDVPSGATVTLQPGGYHVMFMGLKDITLQEGETVPVTLIFQEAGEVDVQLDVVKRAMTTN